jgi:hypothetical protein
VTDAPPDPQDLPLGLRLGAGLVGLEAAALLVLAGVEVISLDYDRLALGITTTAFFVLYAFALGACAYGLWHCKRWSRSPVVLTELIGLGVAWSFFGGSTVWVTVVLGSASIATLVCILLPASTAALTSPPPEPPRDPTLSPLLAPGPRVWATLVDGRDRPSGFPQ